MSGIFPAATNGSRPQRGTRFLRQFFTPESLLLVADPQAPQLANAVLDNLVEGGFPGALYTYAIRDTRKYPDVQQINDLGKIGQTPDLVITCLATSRTPALLEKLADLGVKAAILLRDDDDETVNLNEWNSVRNHLSEIALRSGMRIIGPDCLGIAVPKGHLNATFATQPPLRGRLAYLGQSGMLGACVSSWARRHGIGLSHLISLGDSVDVRLSDMLDYISQRSRTQAIILHVGQINDARHFVSALREAARRCLVLAIGGCNYSPSLTRELPSTPGVGQRSVILDAVLRRAGTLRIASLDALYDSLEVISRIGKAYRGPRLMLIGNGSAPSLLAAEILSHDGLLAQPTDNTRKALIEAGVLASNRPAAPLDLGGTATPEDFATAVKIIAQDPDIDAVLVIHAPTRVAPPDETATAVIEASAKLSCPLLTAWIGDDEANLIQQRFLRANIASFTSPERAVKAFLRLQHYSEAQELLWQAPRLAGFVTSSELRARAQRIVSDAIERKRNVLSHCKSGQILTAYGIPVMQTEYVRTADEGREVAQRAFGALAVKAVHSQQCEPFEPRDHFDASGATPRFFTLVHNIATSQSMYDSIERLQDRVAEEHPDSTLFNFAIQPMMHSFSTLAVCAGITQDAVFGPVIVFGRAGYGIDVLRDRQVALPPLNTTLASEMIKRSEIYQLMRERFADDRQLVEATMQRLCRVLITLSQICAELPYIKGLEINPLIIKRDELMALDYAASLGEPVRQAIRPYPEGLRELHHDDDGGYTVLRPVKSEDAELIERFHAMLSPESIRFRYFQHHMVLSQRELFQLSSIDYDREMAFIVEHHSPELFVNDSIPDEAIEDGQGEMLGVVRLKIDSDNLRTEFSIIVRDDSQRRGIGIRLMTKAIDYARDSGILEMYGQVMADNTAMRALLGRLGFSLHLDMEEQVIVARLELNPATDDWERLRLQNAI